MAIKVRIRNGEEREVHIPIPSELGRLEEADYIDNWIADNIKGSDGWYIPRKGDK